MDIRILFGRTLLVTEDGYYDVEMYNKDKKLEKDVGYIFDEYVYVFHGRVDKETKKLPMGLYLINDEPLFVGPKNDRDKEAYHISKITELDISTIMSKMSKNQDSFVSQKDIEYANSNSDIFKVVINDSDDFLKVAIKQAINDKNISLSNYKDKQDSQWALLNLKGALTKSTKMTVVRFNDWVEILGLRWTLTLEDNGTDENRPLQEPIVLESEDFL